MMTEDVLWFYACLTHRLKTHYYLVGWGWCSNNSYYTYTDHDGYLLNTTIEMDLNEKP